MQSHRESSSARSILKLVGEVIVARGGKGRTCQCEVSGIQSAQLAIPPTLLVLTDSWKVISRGDNYASLPVSTKNSWRNRQVMHLVALSLHWHVLPFPRPATIATPTRFQNWPPACAREEALWTNHSKPITISRALENPTVLTVANHQLHKI